MLVQSKLLRDSMQFGKMMLESIYTAREFFFNFTQKNTNAKNNNNTRNEQAKHGQMDELSDELIYSVSVGCECD